MTETTKYNSQQRVVLMLKTLAGHELDGMTNSDLVKAMGVNASIISRDLALMREIAFVEPVPEMQGRWRLGPAFVQIALAHANHVRQMEQRLGEVEQRYSRLPA